MRKETNVKRETRSTPVNHGRAVVITTEYRGVFFGYLPESADYTAKTLEPTQVRMCVYWPQQQHGVVTLASTGPVDGSRVTPAAPSILLHGVTAVMECTPEAVKAWESEPWS